MTDLQKIEQLIEDYRKAIQTQNIDSFQKLWTCEGNNILISVIRKFSGIQSITQDFLINGIQAAYKAIELIVESIDITFVSGQTAIIVFKYHTECIRRDNDEEYGIQGLETQVVVKREDAWKLVHIHYSK